MTERYVKVVRERPVDRDRNTREPNYDFSVSQGFVAEVANSAFSCIIGMKIGFDRF